MSTRRTSPFLSTVVAIGGLALLNVPGLQAQGFRWPEDPQNIQVLPPEAKGQALGQIMRGFATALGVRCQHCHVGQGDLADFDFESDDKPAKEKARLMWEMVQAINGTHLAKLAQLGVHDADRLQVTCMTCHRGNSRPVMLGDVLAATIDTAGIDAAVAQYKQLREENYGGFAYDFTAASLLGLSEQLARAGKADAAIRMARLEIEVNGESSNAYFTLGQVQARAGLRDDAIKSFERGEALAPDDAKRFFRAQIDRLRKAP